MSPLVSESKDNLPILIIDRIGILGFALTKKLSESSVVVLVTQKRPPSLDNIIHIPFERKIPKVPDNIYSHIFVIDDKEDITAEFLPSFLRKAQDDKAVFCFCTTLSAQRKLSEEVVEYKRTKVVYLGDLFPAGEIFAKSYVNRFLIQAKNRGRIDVPQDGMNISHPVFFEDAISGILEASFGISSEKIYYALPKHGVSLLSLAHMIQKNDPNIRIDFSNEEPLEPPSFLKEGKFLLPENYPLEERIRNLKITAGHFEIKNKSKYKENTYDNFSLKKFRLLAFSIIFFIFLPLITTLFFSYLGYLSLDRTRMSLENSGSLLNLSKSSFTLADSFSKPLAFETRFIQIGLLSQLMQSVEKGRLQAGNMSEYYSAVDSFSEGKADVAISQLKNFLIFAQSDNKFKMLDNNLFNFISQTINVWPQVLGINSKKTYLILFQNNLLPRPTGGVIQAFGILTLDNGRISDFKTYNTYDSDKNLKGHVEPPFAIRRYLPSVHWFLKDANFNPDFIETAATSSFFVDLENGVKVDGIIAVDLNFIKAADSSLDIAGDKVDDQNFLTNVAIKLTSDLKGKNLAKIFLSKEFADLIQKKDIIFAFNDQSIENVFALNNFSSSVIDYRPDMPMQINDYVAIVESNLDKSTRILRKFNQKVELAENGDILSNINLEFKNVGDSDYKDYLRLVVPQGAVLKKIKIDGSDIDFTDAITDPTIYEAKDFTAPKMLEVEKYDQNSKSFFGFLTTVSVGKTQTVEATFALPGKPSLRSLSDLTYSLHFFKQPGIDSYPFSFSISYPSFFKLPKSPNFSTTVDRDFDLNFNFSQK